MSCPGAASENKSPTMEEVIKVHQKVLDDLAFVNGMFTFAVFVGLTFASESQFNLAEDPVKCTPKNEVAKRLVTYEVVAYSCYLLSSLVAKALKIHLNTLLMDPTSDRIYGHKIHRDFFLSLSVLGSIFGCIFLTLSMADIVQIRLGKLSCKAPTTLNAIGALIGVASVAVPTYTVVMLRSLYHSVQHLKQYKVTVTD